MNILFLCTLVLEQVLSALFCYAVIAFGSILKKNILRADIEVNTDGYYEFNNAISFAPGGFGYKKVDSKKKGLRRNYKSTNVLAVNISSATISAMSQKEKFKLSFTLSVLFDEIFETLFSNITTEEETVTEVEVVEEPKKRKRKTKKKEKVEQEE